MFRWECPICGRVCGSLEDKNRHLEWSHGPGSIFAAPSPAEVLANRTQAVADPQEEIRRLRAALEEVRAIHDLDDDGIDEEMVWAIDGEGAHQMFKAPNLATYLRERAEEVGR